MKKLKLFLLVVLFGSNFSYAQQVNQISNFMYNQLYYNPASAGMHETQVNVNVLGRIQWASIDGAPKLGLVSADYRFPKQNMALGVNVSNYSYSKYSFSDANANYSFFVPLNKKVKLAMGLRGGMTSLRSSIAGSKIWDESDYLTNINNYSVTLPKVGLGFQLNAPKYYVGISVPDLYIGNTKNLPGNTSTSFLNQRRNFILMSGAKIRINDSYNFRPGLTAFYYPATGAIVTANATFEVKDYFWIGASYSTYKAATLTTGAHLSARLRFAYSYELLTGLTKTASVGSHEICLMIKLDNVSHAKYK